MHCIDLIRICLGTEVFTLRLQRKKNASENVVCWSRLLKQCGASSRSSLLWLHTVCYGDVLNGPADDTHCDSRRHLVAISTAEELKVIRQ